MKKAVFFLALLISISVVSAVSTDMSDTYSPRETSIVELFGVLGSINKGQVDVLKDNHIDTPLEFDVGKVNGKNYLWFIAPASPGNYTLHLKDLVASVNGVPQVVDYEESFLVNGTQAVYSIKPGFIITNKNFQLTSTVYSDFSQVVQTNFPSQREVTLTPGINYVSFSIANIVGTQETTITFGDYEIPAYIVGAEYVCGDGSLNGREVCDGENLNGQSCSSFSSQFDGGDLSCSSTCLSFDTSSCTVKPVCSPERQDLCATESQCSQASGYWYNETCNQYEQGAVCDENHIGLCETESTCTDSQGYWYNETCNSLPEPICGDGIVNSNEVCDCPEGNCTLSSLNNESCVSLAKGYISGLLGCSDDCLSYNETQCVLETEASFHFEPSAIRSTLLVTDAIPTYRFGIKNTGEGTLTGIFLDYDRTRFRVSPSENISISQNETQYFNLTLIGNITSVVKGAIVASVDDKFEYLLFNLNFTEDTSDTGTDYTGNDGDQPTCAALGGSFCESNEDCTSLTVRTLDSPGGTCCTGVCQLKDGEGGRSWIGYIIAVVALAIIIFIYFKYRKTKPSGKVNPLAQRMAQVERKLP